VGLQTIQINHRSIQLCAVALGQPVVFEDEEEQDILDTMDPRLNIWRTLLIYRIDHHRLTCLAHLNMADYPDSRLGFLGREVFFFSSTEQAWTQPWLEIISPDHASRVDMAYMLAFGPNLPRYGGRCYIVQLDVDGQETTLDPIQTELVWHPRLQRFIPHTQSTTSPSYPAQLITTVRLGSEVSCMYHFRHSPQLHHLICTGNYDTDEVSIWDWRFGIKVGLIPGGDKENIQPWGFETTWAI
ncbi:uncharacterized protein B0P05DRAFT_448180, partial [Gilbertella persicaria]|uniref:uncharacterized protein n=1 Tax=Gilbertella persicaria TaxID=101096 RepID=UPI002220D4BD